MLSFSLKYSCYISMGAVMLHFTNLIVIKNQQKLLIMSGQFVSLSLRLLFFSILILNRVNCIKTSHQTGGRGVNLNPAVQCVFLIL